MKIFDKQKRKSITRTNSNIILVIKLGSFHSEMAFLLYSTWYNVFGDT